MLFTNRHRHNASQDPPPLSGIIVADFAGRKQRITFKQLKANTAGTKWRILKSTYVRELYCFCYFLARRMTHRSNSCKLTRVGRGEQSSGMRRRWDGALPWDCSAAAAVAAAAAGGGPPASDGHDSSINRPARKRRPTLHTNRKIAIQKFSLCHCSACRSFGLDVMNDLFIGAR